MAGQRPAFIEGIRPLGMGGGFIALADDENVQFYNPAGLALFEEGKVLFPYLGGQLNSGFVDNIKYIDDQSTKFEDIDLNQSIVDDLTDMEFNAKFESGLAYLNPGFGLGLYETAILDLNLDEALFIPEAELYLGYDIITMVSKASTFADSDAAWGVNFKLIRRAYVYENKNLLQYSDMDGDYLSERAVGYWGMGFDVGFMAPLGEDKQVALVAQDLFTRLRGDTYRPNLKIGMAWDGGWNAFGLIKDAVLVADVVDIIGDDDEIPMWHNPVKKWTMDDMRDSLSLYLKRTHIGIESTPASILKLRMGFGQGYPSFGTSLDLGSLGVDYALFGKEFGTYPGSMGRYYHKFAIALVF